MRRFRFPLCAIVLLAGLLPAALQALAAAPESDPAVPAILTSAETLFQAMRARDYRGIFASLTSKSKITIVEETVRAIASAKGSAPAREEVSRDFEEGGPVAREYWDAYLQRFDPGAVLERSRWEMGTVTKNRAEILLIHKRSQSPARLQMFREEDSWKTGLVETFWTR